MFKLLRVIDNIAIKSPKKDFCFVMSQCIQVPAIDMVSIEW